jgi:hypothetical protein
MSRKLMIFAGIAVLVAGLVSFSIREKFMADEQYRSYIESEQRYINAMKNDTYGDKTPEETLSLFVVALKAGDMELASKYFMLDSGPSRDKWVKTLVIFKEQGLLEGLIQDIEKDPSLVELRLNEFSGAWKIINFK